MKHIKITHNDVLSMGQVLTGKKVDFIIKAVNNHYQMKEALEEVLSTAICNGDFSITYAVDGNIARKIRNLLSQLEDER